MIPGQIFFIRQSLNKACRLAKPKPAAMAAFRGSLLTLLNQAEEKKSGEDAENYLLDILKGTCFAPGYGEPGNNSSPVCFANSTGLREGFGDPFLPELPTPPDFEINSPPGNPSTSRLLVNADLREALHAIQSGVRQILAGKQASPQVNTMLEKQIKELVYQLYELTPAEIVQLEEFTA
jgi:hypothetical protein